MVRRVSATDSLPGLAGPPDEAECPSCASALFPAPADSIAGWRWSHAAHRVRIQLQTTPGRPEVSSLGERAAGRATIKEL